LVEDRRTQTLIKTQLIWNTYKELGINEITIALPMRFKVQQAGGFGYDSFKGSQGLFSYHE
jgi:hypothetical protein